MAHNRYNNWKEIVYMFGAKKYSLTGAGVASTVSGILQKGAIAVQSLDKSTIPMPQRMEQEIGNIINANEDVQFILMRIRSMFDTSLDFVVTPIIEDSTLLIKEYVLAITSAQGVLQPVVKKPDMNGLMNYLTEVVLSRDEAILKAFVELVSKAYNAVK
jgi:hypothetical protein